jgi:hypothetical protein
MWKKTGESVGWIIFFFTATWLMLCGVLFSVVSGCLGLCPNGLSISLLVGGPLEGQWVLRCGKLRLFVSFGAYGGKWTIGALRIWKVHWRRFYSLFTLRCTFRLRLMCIFCRLVLMTCLLVFLFLIRCFLCILPVY